MTPQQYMIGIWTDLLTPEHKRKIGASFWYFCWLVDKVTEQYEADDGQVRGKVLGGKPVTREMISEASGDTPATVRKHLSDLWRAGYIDYRQTGRGYQIEVLYAKWRKPLIPGPSPSPPTDSGGTRVQDSQSSRVVETRNSDSLTGLHSDSRAICQSRDPSIKDNAPGSDKQPNDYSTSMMENAREAGETETLRAACLLWSRVLESLRSVNPVLATRMQQAQPVSCDDNVLYVWPPAGAVIRRTDTTMLSDRLTRLTGKRMTVQFVDGENQARDGPQRGENDAGAVAGASSRM